MFCAEKEKDASVWNGRQARTHWTLPGTCFKRDLVGLDSSSNLMECSISFVGGYHLQRPVDVDRRPRAWCRNSSGFSPDGPGRLIQDVGRHWSLTES